MIRKEASSESFPPITSLPCRLLNQLGKPFASRVSFDVDKLMQKACQITGLCDWGNMDFFEPLRVLTASYEEDARLTPVGRLLTQKAQLHRLSNRLRIQREVTLHPEILNSTLAPVVFITGLPRTGTTLLHRLLSQDPEIRTLKAWELALPSPSPEPTTYDHDPRRYAIGRSLKKRQRLLLSAKGWEQLQAVHPMTEDEPEECWLLLQNSFQSIVFFVFDRVSHYDSWLSNQDFEQVYHYYRNQLQLLNWKYSGTHLVLKAPEHLGHLNALFRVFPDAKILMTHRNLTEVIPSVCHLFDVFRHQRSDEVDPKEIGRVSLHWILDLLKRGTDSRNKIGPERFLDISFPRLVSDPMDIIRRVYSFIGKELTEEAESRMRSWLSKNHPYSKQGPWKPFLHRYGLAEEQIRTSLNELAEYVDRFSEYMKV